MIPTCLTLDNIRYVSRVTWRNPGKGRAPSLTPQCSSYWKGRLPVALDKGRQLYFTNIFFVRCSLHLTVTHIYSTEKNNKSKTFFWCSYFLSSSSEVFSRIKDSYVNGGAFGSLMENDYRSLLRFWANWFEAKS